MQGSWKEQLRRKFKNLRRPSTSSGGSKRSREEHDGGRSDENDAPTRRPKKTRSEFAVTEAEGNSYDDNVIELQMEAEKDAPSKTKLKRLMQDTFTKRRQWINNDLPTVLEVVEKFPPLKKPRSVSCCENI